MNKDQQLIEDKRRSLIDFFQEVLITLLNPVYSVTNKISEKARDYTVQGLYLVGFAYFIISRSRYLRHRFFVGLIAPMVTRHILGTVLLVVIAILTINKPLHKVMWRSYLIYLQVLTGLGIIVVSFLHPVGSGYRIFGFQMVFIFPLLYFVWNNNNDYHKLIRQIVLAVVIIGEAFYIGTYALAFKGKLFMAGGRYMGVMSNATCFSLVGMELVLGAMYLLASERPGWKRTIFAGVALGMGTGVLILGQSRTAILAIIICGIVTLVYCFRHFGKRLSQKTLMHIVVTCFLALIVSEATMPMVSINSKAIEKKIKEEKVVTEDIQPMVDPVTNTTYDADLSADRIIPEPETDLNTYSNGRIFIWKNYISKLNWLGNDFDQYDPVEMTGDPNNKYAHNIFLEIAYRCGVPVGIIAMIFYIIEGCVCIGFLFRKTENKPDYLLFPIISCIAFAMVALLDVAVMPFFQAEALLYYISIALAVDKELK